MVDLKSCMVTVPYLLDSVVDEKPLVTRCCITADAIQKSIDPEDSADTYKKALQLHVARLDNAKKVTQHKRIFATYIPDGCLHAC